MNPMRSGTHHRVARSAAHAVVVAAVAFHAAACGAPQAPTPVPPQGPASLPASMPHGTATSTPTLAVELTVTASLSAERLRQHVSTLAADAMEGRGAATPGLEKAARYLARTLEDAQLAPAFGNELLQPFEMNVGTKMGKKNRLAQKGARLRVGVDFEPFNFSSSGSIEGPLVFAGFGIASVEHKYDDYEGLDVAGKVVVVLSDEPGEDDPNSPFDGKRTTHYSEIRGKVLRAREAKAKAILVIRPDLGKAKKKRRFSEPESDAGIVALKVAPKAAQRLLGFDPLALRRQIDERYQPASRPSERPPVTIETDIIRERRTVHNVVGVLDPPGGPAAESVVIGAHYDHLGYGGWSSLADGEKAEIHNGADDNASGTSVVLEVARAMAQAPEGLRRRVYFVLFAGEESGLLGSAHFVKSLGAETSSVVAMINLDMVGRLRNNKLNFMGTKSGLEMEALARRFALARGLKGTYGGDGYGPSDHTPFYSRGIPVLFLFTGAHTNYHKPSDDPDTLNYPGMAEVGAVAADLVRALATAQGRPTHVEHAPPKRTGGRGYGPYFGSIPEFGEEVEGVMLAGVREDSPASKAGVQKGDVIVKFNGVTVKSLEDFTVALRASAPGDEVEVEVRRGAQLLKLRATLQKRE